MMGFGETHSALQLNFSGWSRCNARADSRKWIL